MPDSGATQTVLGSPIARRHNLNVLPQGARLAGLGDFDLRSEGTVLPGKVKRAFSPFSLITRLSFKYVYWANGASGRLVYKVQKCSAYLEKRLKGYKFTAGVGLLKKEIG